MHSCNHDHSQQEHAAIEWHDSEITAISRLPNALVLDIRAVVHRSQGNPGTDPGTVWVQPAAVILDNCRLTGPPPALPGNIAAGQVWSDYDYNSMIRCPFTSNAEASLDLTLSSGERLWLDADQLTITFTGEPEFLEDFVPERIEDDYGV